MDRLKQIQHRGKPVVLLDFTDATDTDRTCAELREVIEWFSRQPPTQSLRTVSDVTGARYNAAVLEALKELAVHNKPYVGAAAAVVRTALHRVALNVAAMFSGRKFQAFTTREEALDWVAGQPVGGEAR